MSYLIFELNRYSEKNIFLRNRLKNFILKFMRNVIDDKELVDLLNKKLTDKEYFNIFLKLDKSRPPKKENLQNINSSRGEKRVQDLLDFVDLELLQELPKYGNYLDIGSTSETSITEVMGTTLGFEEGKIFATDIVDLEMLTSNVIFRKCNGSVLDFPSRSFSFITLFQVLHHMKNLDKMLAEISRVCKPNAMIFVREHDLGDYEYHRTNRDLFKLEHAFCEILLDGKTYDNFANEYWANYKTKEEWVKIFKKYGFEFLAYKAIDKNNFTNYYYAIYKYVGVDHFNMF